jgi:hypothetical protein
LGFVEGFIQTLISITLGVLIADLVIVRRSMRKGARAIMSMPELRNTLKGIKEISKILGKRENQIKIQKIMHNLDLILEKGAMLVEKQRDLKKEWENQSLNRPKKHK